MATSRFCPTHHERDTGEMHGMTVPSCSLSFSLYRGCGPKAILSTSAILVGPGDQLAGYTYKMLK